MRQPKAQMSTLLLYGYPRTIYGLILQGAVMIVTAFFRVLYRTLADPKDPILRSP
jgi:hypothetical protein